MFRRIAQVGECRFRLDDVALGGDRELHADAPGLHEHHEQTEAQQRGLDAEVSRANRRSHLRSVGVRLLQIAAEIRERGVSARREQLHEKRRGMRRNRCANANRCTVFDSRSRPTFQHQRSDLPQ